jgi:hypothetical protein
MSKQANIVLSAFCENLKENRQTLERIFESHFEMFDPVISMGDEYSLHKKYWIKDKVGLFTASELRKEVVVPDEPTFMFLFKTKDIFLDLFIETARKNNRNLYIYPINIDTVKIDKMLPLLSKFIEKIPKKSGSRITTFLIIFMLFNATISVLATNRWIQRNEGVAAKTSFEKFIDIHFDDEKMNTLFPNMQEVKNTKV